MLLFLLHKSFGKACLLKVERKKHMNWESFAHFKNYREIFAQINLPKLVQTGKLSVHIHICTDA